MAKANNTKTTLILQQYEVSLRIANVPELSREQLGVLEKTLNLSMDLITGQNPKDNVLQEAFGTNYNEADYATKQQLTRVRSALQQYPGGESPFTNQSALGLYAHVVNQGHHVRHCGKKTQDFLAKYLKDKGLL